MGLRRRGRRVRNRIAETLRGLIALSQPLRVSEFSVSAVQMVAASEGVEQRIARIQRIMIRCSPPCL